jgi:hypothetical protein
MNDKPIDFTSLDPSRNARRWDARIEFIASQAVARRGRRWTVTGQLVLWSRPMLAVAASVALVGWLGLAVFGTQTVSHNKVDPAAEITTWAARDEVPNAETVISALGGSIGEK